MRYSQLFAKTLREAPKDADTINHKLLVQAGYVDQLMAGVYSYLPLGLRVLRNIEQIVREEMDAIGGSEILMPILHPKDNWVTTGGWDSIDVLFKIQSRTKYPLKFTKHGYHCYCSLCNGYQTAEHDEQNK